MKTAYKQLNNGLSQQITASLFWVWCHAPFQGILEAKKYLKKHSLMVDIPTWAQEHIVNAILFLFAHFLQH